MIISKPNIIFRLSNAIILGIMAAIILTACSTDTMEERDDNGNLVAQYEVRDGVKHGKFTGYHSDGSIFEESTYIDGNIHGIRSLYYEGNRKIQTSETYVHGVMDGLFEEYHMNGQLAFTGLYINDAMEGIWKKYNESGQLIEEVTFADSEENGPFKEYHSNGQLATAGGYLDGDNEHGLLEVYNEQGKLVKKMDCNKGICRTTWTIDAFVN